MKKSKISTLKNGRQNHAAYTDEDHLVWRLLFDKQMEQLGNRASLHFMEGLKKTGFTRENIPHFEEVNRRLIKLTGWQVVAVEGIVEDREFFELLSERKFPATTWLRSQDQLEYLEEPDMFHDVFAHVPLLSNPAFADFLQQISRIALRYAGNEEAIELLSRVYWFTVEFGLIREKGQLRIYGAGILSSAGESTYCLGLDPMHFEFGVEQILNTGYCKSEFQDRYFIIDSFEKLFASTAEISELIDTMMSKRKIFAPEEMSKNGQDLVPSW